MASQPPKAPQHLLTHTFHDHERTDEYAWLRDDNWQQVMQDPTLLRPEIRAYLEAENAYAAEVLAEVAEAEKALFEEMKARLKPEDSSVPAPDGEYAYYQRFEAASQHPIFCRKHNRADSAEEVILDANAEAEGKRFFRVSAAEHSPDHRLLAYAADEKGSEHHTVVVRDIATGAVLEDTVRNAAGSVEWANDSATFFYAVLDEHHRPSRVFRHTVGEDSDADALVYAEPDAGFFVGAFRTESRRFLTISAHDHVTSEVRVVDLASPAIEPRLLAPRDPGVEYHPSDHGQQFLIHTNAGGAEDFKIVEAPIDDAARENWRDVVPHRPGCLLLMVRVFAGYLARLERVDGLARIVIRRFSDGEEHTISFDEEAYDLSIVPGYEYETTTLRFVYSSPATPREIYDYDMERRERVLRKRQEIPSGHDPSRYVTRRLMATAPDGEQVPISVLYARDVPLDGTAPLLLYGYGAYGAAMLASFSPNRFSLVDRGFVYAIAHIRGGADRGYRWYREGRGANKPNTFSDFIAAAEHLIAGRFSSAGRIAAFGGSAGGMLVGAAVNQRPDLFGAIVAEVPFVDVLNTMTDSNLPLTPPEWPEWGNPVEDEAAYRTILSYSPYDNVEARDYPPMLVTAGLSDPRVTYWEPAKWVARLRARKTDSNPLLLKTNMEAGHAGASGRFAKLEEIATIYAFLLKVLGRLDRVQTGSVG